MRHIRKSPSAVWCAICCVSLILILYVSRANGGSFTLQTSSITVSQNAGSASIPVEFQGSMGWMNYQEVYYNTLDGTAVSGQHYESVDASMSLDEDERIGYISVPILYSGSTVDRTFSVVLTDASYANLGAITSCTVTIKAEPERPPVIFNLGAARYSVSQDVGAVQIPVTYSGATRDSKVWVKYRTTAGTANGDDDYQGTYGSVINYAVNSRTAYIVIPIFLTKAAEDKYFTVQLLEVSEGQLGSLSSARVTIKGVPPPPPIVFRFGAANHVVTQTAGKVVVPVTYTGTPLNSSVRVEYRTQGATATSGTDYEGTSSSVLTFPAGKKKAYITIPIYHTGSREARSFNLFLEDTSEGILGAPAVARVTIKREVAPPRIAFDNTKGRIGPIIIRGRVLDVPIVDIKRVSLTIGGKAFPVTGKSQWKTQTLSVSAPGNYLMKVTATLANGEKITKQAVFRVSR